MGLLSAIDISASGLNAQRKRLEVISSNLANANTTRTVEGGPYRRKDLVFEAAPVSESFNSTLNSALGNSGEASVEVTGIYEDETPPIKKYDPSHPDADAEGFVFMPNVNPIEEMINMISATRSFEANVQSINTIKQMAQKSLEIGR
jgi:flagellar basal-body rod protein FlgC